MQQDFNRRNRFSFHFDYGSNDVDPSFQNKGQLAQNLTFRSSNPASCCVYHDRHGSHDKSKQSLYNVITHGTFYYISRDLGVKPWHGCSQNHGWTWQCSKFDWKRLHYRAPWCNQTALHNIQTYRIDTSVRIVTERLALPKTFAHQRSPFTAA